jgi:3-oxoacyl-(acyl-carrier-protein) synthase
VAVLQGAEMIRHGVCDTVIAGSVDAALEPILLRAFRTMRVLAPAVGEPHAAIRPWDRERRGFLVGEGGAVFVMEREDRARARGVLPYAEVAGGAMGADAHHETSLNPDPTGLAHVLTSSLARAGVSPSEIDTINVHGTATRSNDILECRAIRRAFGTHAGGISCTANKGQIGHLLGAAGSAELAITCLSMRDGFVPPTVNLTDPDPLCDLDATPLVGRRRAIDAALKLSIGFGGHLVSAVLYRRGPGPYRERREHDDG